MDSRPSVLLRPATAGDAPHVAEIWCAGWRDGHLGGVPDELVAVRTPESFRKRAAERLQDTTVATIDGSVAGFIMVMGAEVEQVYVAAEHRGRGVAQVLLTAAEQKVAGNGFAEAWLAVVPSNTRARAFYAKAGWIDRGLFDHKAPTEAGPITVPAHRYTKRVAPSDFAFWRRLDVPGHDAALLSRTGSGWALTGTAVFRHGDGPACLRYDIALDRDWTTRRGRVEGFLSGQEVNVLVERGPGGWVLNGSFVPGLGHLVDLDLGFTPATNLQQLRRVEIGIGQAMDLPVAWLDADARQLVELPQRYERRNTSTYWYVAPTVPYEAMLKISPNGFVSLYPGLWQAELPGVSQPFNLTEFFQ